MKSTLVKPTSAPKGAKTQTGLRQFLQTSGGQVLLIGGLIIALGLAVYAVVSNLGPGEAGKISRDRMYIDAATGKPYEHTLKPGDSVPTDAPSGGKTGYPAELCYWTKDGKIKQDPTPVLVNARMGKPGPTFCPDCGRLVVMHNPPPLEGNKPPPTKEEYDKRQSNRRPTDRGDER
ncbi:MAG TPA: DUF1206 domain-containing protein [Tepidisphaeraceae bacterium]|jgi:hypothetical protein